MTTTEVLLPKHLSSELQESFLQGPMIDASGQRRLDERLVGRLEKMSIVIRANEHPPPHFHVIFAGENASFGIDSGTRLKNVKGLERFERNICKWWEKNYCELIKVWNETRPSECKVGPVAVPPECEPVSKTAEPKS